MEQRCPHCNIVLDDEELLQIKGSQDNKVVGIDFYEVDDRSIIVPKQTSDVLLSGFDGHRASGISNLSQMMVISPKRKS